MAQTRQARIVAFAALILIPSLLPAQHLSVGFTAGLPLNDLATASGDSATETGRYTLGPSVRLSLTHAIALDVDLLYKHFDIGFASEPAVIAVHRLELPVLIRYSLMRFSFRPFVNAGISFNFTMPEDGTAACPDASEEFFCIDGRTAAQLRHEHTHGVVVGTGIQFRTRSVGLAPQLRVTRWVDRNFGTRDSPLRSNLTQIELLIHVSF